MVFQPHSGPLVAETARSLQEADRLAAVPFGGELLPAVVFQRGPVAEHQVGGISVQGVNHLLCLDGDSDLFGGVAGEFPQKPFGLRVALDAELWAHDGRVVGDGFEFGVHVGVLHAGLSLSL